MVGFFSDTLNSLPLDKIKIMKILKKDHDWVWIKKRKRKNTSVVFLAEEFQI